MLEDKRPSVKFAIEILSNAISNGSWSSLYQALVPFKDPLEGGIFSISELDESFFAILESGVMKKVYLLRNKVKNEWNAQALDASVAVCFRVIDIISCSQEVNEKCYGECGSPESRCLSPTLKV